MRLGKNMLETTNPALKNHDAWRDGVGACTQTETASVAGVVNKTGMLTSVAVAGGMLGIWLTQNQPGLAWPLGIVGFIATIVVYFMIMRNPTRAKYTAWIYAAIQGAFLGALTHALDSPQYRTLWICRTRRSTCLSVSACRTTDVSLRGSANRTSVCSPRTRSGAWRRQFKLATPPRRMRTAERLAGPSLINALSASSKCFPCPSLPRKRFAAPVSILAD